MELSTWLVYVSVISILLLSPGPSALLCVSDGLKFGNQKALPTVLGGASAALVLMSISAVGLGALLAASETLFLIVKLIGAFYLISLGWAAWKENGIQIKENTLDENKVVNYSPYACFQKGFMVGISNPKDLLFFIALFPSFMNADLPQIEQYIVLAGTWFCLDFSSMFMYVAIGSKIGPFLSKPRNMCLVNRTVGSIFMLLGGALAFSSGINNKI